MSLLVSSVDLSYSPITIGPSCTLLPNTQYYTDIPLDDSIFWVMPMTQNGTLKLERKADPNNAYRRSLNKKLSYKIDYGQWTSITENNFLNTGISVSMGQKIYLRSATNTAFDLWKVSDISPYNSYETSYGFKFVGGNWSTGGDTASLFNLNFLKKFHSNACFRLSAGLFSDFQR